MRHDNSPFMEGEGHEQDPHPALSLKGRGVQLENIKATLNP
jgi:hypothetical protein